MVGYTEDTLKKEGIPFSRSFDSHLAWPTYRRVGLQHAAYKILVGDDRQIIGAHILADNAAGIINTIRLAMLNRIPVDTLYYQSIMSPYPTRESDLLYMLKPFV
jgi:glutathione reductase (NADPH)